MNAPTTPLELTGPVPPEERRSTRIAEAMKAALGGDFGPLDRIEIDYLNLLARIGELVVRDPDGKPHVWCTGLVDSDGRAQTHAPFVTAIVRGYGPQARQALEWQLREKCLQCAGKLRRLPCRVCDGRWYVEDMSDHEAVYTDVDGVLFDRQP